MAEQPGTQEEQQTNLLEAEITEEIAEKAGLHHDFVGKPLEEVINSYKAIVGKNTQTSQENSAIKQQLAELQEKIDGQANQEETDDEIPDPVTEPRKYKTWFDKQVQAAVSKVTSEYESKLNPLMKKEEERTVQSTLSELKAVVSDEKELIKEIDKWATKNGIQNQEELQAILKDPKSSKIMINGIKDQIKANSIDDILKAKGDADIEKLLSKHKKDTKSYELNSNDRNQPSKKSMVSEIADELRAKRKQE